jgi:hypothetical protein
MLSKKNIEKFFLKNGYYDFGNILEKSKCTKLKNIIDENRPCNKSIFFKTKKDFKKSGRLKNYSPGEKEFNAIFNLNLNLKFIENSKNFQKAVESIVGQNYTIKKKSIIRSVPKKLHPQWVLDVTENVGRPNVNPYIKKEYQDVQYFQNIDFHQDMTRGKKFVTFYIYLDEVKKKDSPLNILQGSYKFGATHYPHYLRPSSESDYWYYSDLKKNHMKTKEVSIFGNIGKVFCFHGLILHGTKLNLSVKPRISLRYLISPDEKKIKSPFMKSFKFINGKIVENKKLKNGIYFQRLDRSADGNFLKTGSSIL